tara:strand:+ start:528 stop:680 length:153 start_codon:yes stop_codon:yes gene_type:complete
MVNHHPVVVDFDLELENHLEDSEAVEIVVAAVVETAVDYFDMVVDIPDPD